MRYNFFDGMTADEIADAQTPYAGWADTGWATETRAFAAVGADAPPKWSDFRDPMDALGTRFRKVRERLADTEAGISPETRAAFRTLDLPVDADLHRIRKSYSTLVRRYHPDRNGGDRTHEKALQAVIEAYTHLKNHVRPRA